MGEIKKQSVSPLAKTAKLNEVIAVVNALGYNMTVRAGVGDETPQLKLADNNCELIVSAGDDDGGGGGGLPEYPGEAPSIEIKAPLIWDNDNEEARWLQGDPQEPTDPKNYADIFAYDPNPSFDTFSLIRTEYLDGIICENGEAVYGKIFFARDDPQP